jgi:hypothetical protein
MEECARQGETPRWRTSMLSTMATTGLEVSYVVCICATTAGLSCSMTESTVDASSR